MVFLNNAMYDRLKWVAQYVLPAFAALYFGISQIWGLPYPERIVGSIVAFDAFLGALLGLSSIQYKAFQKENSRVLDRYNQLSYLSEEKDNSVLIPTTMFGMDPKTYQIAKWVTLILMPSLGALYFGLSRIWGFPLGEEIVGTIASITTFAGIFLGVSSAQYKSVNRTE